MILNRKLTKLKYNTQNDIAYYNYIIECVSGTCDFSYNNSYVVIPEIKNLKFIYNLFIIMDKQELRLGYFLNNFRKAFTNEFLKGVNSNIFEKRLQYIIDQWDEVKDNYTKNMPITIEEYFLINYNKDLILMYNYLLSQINYYKNYKKDLSKEEYLALYKTKNEKI